MVDRINHFLYGKWKSFKSCVIAVANLATNGL